ncbi:MAG TPA: hypothetical protein H9844_10195 [Candidatus Evtepia faecigallinarum]|nr:hypothetical protein [Candidatus Evtepia faecigallinarum]
MKDKFKAALDQVRADQALKEDTLAFLAQETQGFTGRPKGASGTVRRLVPAAACLVLVLLGGGWLYFTPTAAISVDINPSLELTVNRFDKVLSAQGFNEEGQALADTLDLSFAHYTDVVEELLATDQVTALLSGDAVLTITVVGGSDSQSARLLSGVETCTAGRENAYCYCAHGEDMEAAHDAGLSYGKYQAFLALQALDPSVTAEEAQGMTMRELRDRIAALGGDPEATGGHTDSSGHHGNGNGQNGSGQGNGQGQGYGYGGGSGGHGHNG